ncbi:MAG: secondary thiamine-phosphate synthase enzyme YjbQ [Thermoleophilia bacterium]
MPTRKKTIVPGQASVAVFSRQLEFPMREELDILNITDEISRVVQESTLRDGTVTVFVPGATGVVTCLEYEPGVIADFKAAIDRIAPRDIPYDHNLFQADGNGHAHVRAGLIGPSLAIPFIDGELMLGVWQKVVLVNCDNRRRTRKLVVQVVGA